MLVSMDPYCCSLKQAPSQEPRQQKDIPTQHSLQASETHKMPQPPQQALRNTEEPIKPLVRHFTHPHKHTTALPKPDTGLRQHWTTAAARTLGLLLVGS